MFRDEREAAVIWKSIWGGKASGFEHYCGVEQLWLTFLRKLVWQALSFGHRSAHVQSWLNAYSYFKSATTNLSSEKLSGESDVL